MQDPSNLVSVQQSQSKTITITTEDIVQQVKLSCKMPEILQEIVIRKIIASAVEKAGIEVKSQALQKAANAFRLMHNLESTDDTWLWLEKHRLSIDDFGEIVYTNFISGLLAKHLFADKVEPYFFENQLDYTAVVMYEVILDDENLAIEIFHTLETGEISFYEVAHKYIEDVELRRKGGYQGIVHCKDLKPEISTAIFAANPPQMLKPIMTSSGVHLILLEEIIQPQLDEKLYNQILSGFLSDWLKQQFHYIEITHNL